jgi:hypothetical protein
VALEPPLSSNEKYESACTAFVHFAIFEEVRASCRFHCACIWQGGRLQA